MQARGKAGKSSHLPHQSGTPLFFSSSWTHKRPLAPLWCTLPVYFSYVNTISAVSFMQNIQVWGNLVATSWVVPPFRNLQLQDDVRRLISRIGVGADMSTFSLIRVGNFEHGPKPNHFYVSCRKWTTICGRTQTRAKSYSGTPVDKMSAVWKYIKLESGSNVSPTATRNICNMTVLWSCI